jgi:NADPH:quinone reductase and related Zn-dependent oxidoreductases
MKAVTFNPTTDTYSIKDLPFPKLGNNDVLVKVKACGLNPFDAKISLWKSLVPNMSDTWVPGLDVSGEVVEIGKKVTRWKPGDRVLYHGYMLRPHGGFAEYAVQNEEAILHNPVLPHDIAAATPYAGWTAFRAIKDKLDLRSTDSFLIIGGEGEVGSFAIQIASYIGVKKIIVTCSKENFPFVKEMGATHIIDHGKDDIIKKVMEFTDGVGATKAIDAIGPDYDIVAANALSFNGHLLELSGFVRPTKYNDAFMKSLTFHQFSLGGGYGYGIRGLLSILETGRSVMDLVERNLINVPLKKVISLEEVPCHLVEMHKGKTVGKIVMEMKSK